MSRAVAPAYVRGCAGVVALLLLAGWGPVVPGPVPSPRGQPTAGPPAAGQPNTPSKPAVPDPSQEAQRHFDLALALYQEGDLDGALTEFRKAYQVSPSYPVLYNLGLVSRELYDWAGALRYYRDYLAAGAAGIPVDRRLQVERAVRELADRVGRLDIEIKGEGAEVTLDEQPVALTALSGIVVNPGRHRVRVSFGGRAIPLKVVEVASRENVKVAIERPRPVLAAAASPSEARSLAAAGLASAAPADEAKAPLSAHRWTWTATGLLAAGAIASGLLAQHSEQALWEERRRFPARASVLAGHSERVRAYGFAADGMAAGAAVFGLLSIYLTWRGSF
jgi:PEGA domain